MAAFDIACPVCSALPLREPRAVPGWEDPAHHVSHPGAPARGDRGGRPRAGRSGAFGPAPGRGHAPATSTTLERTGLVPTLRPRRLRDGLASRYRVDRRRGVCVPRVLRRSARLPRAAPPPHLVGTAASGDPCPTDARLRA